MSPTPGTPERVRPNLYGMNRERLRELLAAYDAAPFRAAQVYRWLYVSRCYDPHGWTDLDKSLRGRLVADATVDPGTLSDRVEARDGTVKYRVRLAGGGEVESVFMVQDARVTLCLSSQVGCALGCDFCLTGKMGLRRHMTAGEIVGQVALIQEDRALNDTAFNLVFMGMGEPLHNDEAVREAIRLLTDPRGFGISRRRITVSTSGMAPAIERLADEPARPRLAVSLNATTDELRDRLMPINRKWNIARLVRACRTFAARSRERFTLEYVLLAGVNDGPDDVQRLVGIVGDLPAKVNLIPFNPVPGLLAYRPPTRDRVREIRDRLLASGVPVSIRWSRGAEARAACGQLALIDSPTDPALEEKTR